MPYEVTTNKSRLDVDLVHQYLSEESYWATKIPRDVFERSIANSMCFAVFDAGRQVAFARVITDNAVFAYVADVFVLPEHRGRGVSKLMMSAIREHPQLQGLRRWHLVTRDAHGLYKHYGFEPLRHPERHMEILVKNPYI